MQTKFKTLLNDEYDQILYRYSDVIEQFILL